MRWFLCNFIDLWKVIKTLSEISMEMGHATHFFIGPIKFYGKSLINVLVIFIWWPLFRIVLFIMQIDKIILAFYPLKFSLFFPIPKMDICDWIVQYVIDWIKFWWNDWILVFFLQLLSVNVHNCISPMVLEIRI